MYLPGSDVVTHKKNLVAYVGRCLCLPLCMQHGEQHVVRYQDTCMVENRELDRKRRMPKSYNSLGRELAFNASHCLSPHTTKRTGRPLPYAVFLSESSMIQNLLPRNARKTTQRLQQASCYPDRHAPIQPNTRDCQRSWSRSSTESYPWTLPIFGQLIRPPIVDLGVESARTYPRRLEARLVIRGQ